MKAKLARRSAAQLRGRPRTAAVSRGGDAARGVPGGLWRGSPSLDPGTVVHLQALAGNEAVGLLLAQRIAGGLQRWPSVQTQAVDCPPAPPPRVLTSPHDDPRFAGLNARVREETDRQRRHPPARSEVSEAQQAAAGPTNEVSSKAAAAQVEEMGRQRPGSFDRQAFVRAVRQAIERASPRSMEEVDDFARSGKVGQIKGEVAGKVR